MASIFTFESEPPKVSSPWPTKTLQSTNSNVEDGQLFIAGIEMPRAELLANTGITKLEAEPQDGPTEYKLHLLLRPRRSFSSTSTVQNVSGSYLSKSRAPRSHLETNVKHRSPAAMTPSSLSRQTRLDQLTTQLLWRLQQSSCYHSSSKSKLRPPIVPDGDVNLAVSKGPGPLVPGLEESNGALYEIGVSDDGTFVGLAKDELEESLTVLRAMAFSIGCNLQIVRMMIVGGCQWTEETGTREKLISRLRKEKLWVAEVLVSPHLGSNKPATNLLPSPLDKALAVGGAVEEDVSVGITDLKLQSQQLRVSLTGSTTSGKSSLLGTLSTSTLDNGRGKSRLSLLKHRHEIVTGVTSSLAQELFGYQDQALSDVVSPINVINYASGNVSSWNDIHSASEQGRLVFVTDSAGHPRYRRTTIRGLVSWAPHWTLCCVAADDEGDSIGKIGATASSSDILGSAGQGVDLSKAHLDLCLKLNLPLVLIITKLDIATKVGLRSTMAKILSILKSAGRRPAILSTAPNNSDAAQLQTITGDDVAAAERATSPVPPSEMHLLVPIVLTSAVTGSGFGRLHALLRQLPARLPTEQNVVIPGRQLSHFENLFHVDEVFAMLPSTHTTNGAASSGAILSGHLRYGVLEVGGKMLVGPCALEAVDEVPDNSDIHRASSYPVLLKGSPRTVTSSHDRLRPSSGDFTGIADSAQGAPMDAQVWQEVRISSLRYLRLPVRKLSADQVGTVGVTFYNAGSGAANVLLHGGPIIRRGMVMIPTHSNPKARPPPAYSHFSAVFPQSGLPAWPGVLVVVYIASIRASAKIVEVKALESTPIADDLFSFDCNASDDLGNLAPQSPTDNQQTEIMFEFVTSREWIEIGTQALITPGGGPSLTGQPEQRDIGSAGLDGYVGIIKQALVQWPACI